MEESKKNVLKSVFLWCYCVMVPIFLAPLYFGTALLSGLIESPFLFYVMLAAICNAIMDSVESDHIDGTIFSKHKPQFWNKGTSASIAKKIFGWKYDAWHVFKSSMIILLALAIVSYKPVSYWWVDFLAIGWVWNTYFNVFYNHLLKNK